MASGDDLVIFARKSSGLVKALRWWDVFLLVISAPAGSGILYYSVSTSSSFPGGNVALSFLLGMLLVFPVIYVTAATSALIPRSGSLYVLISRVLCPSLGYLAAALFFVGYVLSVGVVAFVLVAVAGGMLTQVGTTASIAWVREIGGLLGAPRGSALGGSLLVVLTWALVLRGVRAFRNAMRIVFVFALSAVLVSIGVFLTSSPSTGGVETRFDTVWGSSAYARIVESAASLGWQSPAFSWQATFNLLLVVLFSYGGLELVSYASGEISQVQKRMVMRGYIAGWISLATLYAGIAGAVTYAFGDFLGAYDFLYQKHQQVLAGIMPPVAPSIPFYATSLMKNGWASAAVSLSLCLWLLNTMIPYFFAPSRLLFALAMDRMVPHSLSNVNSVTGAPTVASHLTLVVALLGVLLNLLDVGVVLGTILFCALFVYWLYGLSALLLPYQRPELYEKAAFQGNVVGLPVISLVGAVAVAVGWFVILVSVRQLSMSIMVTLSVMIGAFAVLYLVQLARNKRHGVNVGRVYDELPPD